MDGAAPKILWTPLSLLESRFSANMEALARRLPEAAETLKGLTPKQVYHIVPISGSIQLGVGNGLGVTPLPHTLLPLSAGIDRKAVSFGIMQPAGDGCGGGHGLAVEWDLSTSLPGGGGAGTSAAPVFPDEGHRTAVGHSPRP